MEQIAVQVKDKEKAKMLLDLLKALDFVDSVSAISHENDETKETTQIEVSDFFSLAGLWEGRDISLAAVRRDERRHNNSRSAG